MIKAPDDPRLDLLQGTLDMLILRPLQWGPSGWLKAEWGVSEANQRARYYQLTAAGKAQLLREQDRWSRLVHALRSNHEPPPADSGK